jgi:hypothetical protein
MMVSPPLLKEKKNIDPNTFLSTNLGFMLLCNINDDEMKIKQNKGLQLKTLLFSYIYIYIYIYKIQMV